MKYLLLLLLFASPLLSIAQDTTKMKQSKFEEFSSEDGILKKMETHKFGKIKGFIMYKKTTTNVETGKFFNAVEITEKLNLWTGKGGGSIIFDEDEIPSLIKTLKYFLANVMTDECKDECPSYSFETNGGVNIYCSKTVGAYASNWHVYIRRSGYLLTYGYIDLDTKDFDNFIKLMETYK